jgi:hypothetical protein
MITFYGILLANQHAKTVFDNIQHGSLFTNKEFITYFQEKKGWKKLIENPFLDEIVVYFRYLLLLGSIRFGSARK